MHHIQTHIIPTVVHNLLNSKPKPLSPYRPFSSTKMGPYYIFMASWADEGYERFIMDDFGNGVMA